MQPDDKTWIQSVLQKAYMQIQGADSVSADVIKNLKICISLLEVENDSRPNAQSGGNH
jgi:hypothetical protein